jgi:AcrR family transcriptional regulator
VQTNEPHRHAGKQAETPRERLLRQVVAHVAAEGVSGMTLRGLAAAIGTSHRMLLYHFGSKEQLLIEVVRAVERRQRELLAEFLPPGDTDAPADELRAWWRHISDRSLWPNARLFFELYGQALQSREHTEELLEDIVESWLQPAAALSIARGVPESDARAQARLGIAVTRGLLLDLLATEDVEGVDGAMEAYIGMYQALMGP